MSRDKLIEAIEHYQRNLNRGIKDENTTKLLHCIFKLSNMPITVAHLEETGVGRTVNAMRKIDGEVGDAARELVNKWKVMVSQNQDCDEMDKSESNSKSDSSHRSSDKPKTKERYKQEQRQKSEEREKPDESESESENSSSDEKSSEESSGSSEEEEEDEEEEEPKRYKSESPPRRNEKTPKYQSGKDDKHKGSTDRHRDNGHKHDESSSKHKANSEKYKENKDKHREHKERSKEKEKYSSRSPEKEKYKSGNEKRRSRSPEKSKSKEKYKESSKRKRDTETDDSYAKKLKSTERDEDRYKKEKEKYTESKHKEKDKKETKKDDSRSKSKEKHKKTSEEKPKSNPKLSRNEYGICSESGTSFADALGMLEPSTSKGPRKSKPDKPKEKERERTPEKPKSESKEKQKRDKDKPSSHTKQELTKEVEKKSIKMEVVIPPPPKNDIDINISSLLPTITPNYRPLANPLYDNTLNLRNKALNDDEALSLVMSQKNQRTKVYSGNKTFWGSVPTLFDLCIRILQDNIDALEYTGGVPFAILKPVLDKANPQQLYMMEHYNPYLIEDTDEIWKFHCSKEFKNKKRQELESWRDMYMRCLDEREAKLKALTENIKVSQEKSTPVRQTKLAYIDSVVKPPRDVIRKQAKNGIDKKPLITPQSRLNAIASGSSNAQVSVPNPVRASSSNSSAAVKPKKAPLMQKTLAFLKGGRFRR